MKIEEKEFKGLSFNDVLQKALNYFKLNSPDDLIITIKRKGGNFFFFKKNWVLKIKPKISQEKNDYSDLRVEEALKISEELDGYFSIDYKDNGAYLTVYPPGKSGKPVSIDEILNRVRVLKLENVNEELIKKAVAEKNSQPLRIADWPHGEALNAYFKIEVSIDKLEAYLIMYPPKPGGAKINVEDIFSGLQSKGITYGILNDTIKEVIEKEIYFKKILIAKGLPPEKGEDAEIFYKVNLEPKIKPQIIDEKGNVDLKELGFIQSIKKGDIIAEKKFATKGKAGINIFGKTIPAIDGIDKEFNYNKETIELSKDGSKLISKIDGRIIVRDNKLFIEKILHIDSDINYSTGNINFAGTVIINGKVEDNFKVIADGEIIIKKYVGKSYIYSKDNIIIEGGILGKGESLIKSEKNVYAKFIENGNVIAGENIIVDKVIMHSNISAGNTVLVKGDKGAIIGGITRAGKQVIAKELGAIGGTYTEIEAGVDPEILFKINSLNEKRVEELKKVNKIALGVETLERKKLNNTINEKESEQLKQLKAMLDRATSKLEDILNEINQLKNLIKPDYQAKIKCKNKVFAGTKIIIANLNKFIKDDNKYSYVTFKYGDNDFKILPFD
ncbi:MAG TPA: FapA family protein [bacterium]|nr:FapA family protein [bacterium]HOL47019.1 FapA family protein [bacterium]HPQ18479.1 FapA family protein [bacterium]